ncbi:MAG: outer membrane lipoprotein carrier protein LolA [Candidatus Acidoferrales bacterium]
MKLAARPQTWWLLGLLLVAGAGGAGETPTEDVVGAVERHYSRVRTLEAEFVQRYTYGATTLVESGRVYFKKPGRMRWDYNSPEEKLFLADGQYAYLYVPQEQQVRRYPVKEAPQWQAAFALLFQEKKADLGRVFDRIQVVRLHRLEGPARWQLRGLPKSDKQGFTEIWLDLNRLYQVVRVEIRQRDSSLMEFHFRHWRENHPLDADLFKLDVPPGTTWVTEEGN